MKYLEFIKWAKENNWNITWKKYNSLALVDDISSRYKNIPYEYIEFLKRVKELVSQNEKTWFLTEDIYNSSSDIAFKWNELELLSIEAAEDDEVWQKEITSWWKDKLPIVMSVDNGYSYYAIDLSNGGIIVGYEPEFEEAEAIASNIEEFFELIIQRKINI